MNKKQLAEMIKHLRHQRKMKMEHPTNRPVGRSSKEQHHVSEGIGPTHAAGLTKRAGVISKMPSDRKRYQGGNQERDPGTYMGEAEEDMGPTKTGQKGKRQEKINLNPEQKDNIV